MGKCGALGNAPTSIFAYYRIFLARGHTAHETQEEAHKEALLMLKNILILAENWLAIPVIAGVKSEKEKFAGADKTYTFEGVMQDGKAFKWAHRICFRKVLPNHLI